MKNKFTIIVFALIIFIAAFLRLFMLDEVPNGLQQDETSIAYNALSILETGKDEHGANYPLYFKAFGEYKLPLSIYLTSLSFAIFGISEFSLRLPSAFFGILTVIVLFFTSRIFFQKDKVGLLAMGLLAINPWHIHFSRGAYEVTPALFFITLGVFLYYAALRRKSGIVLTISFVSLLVATYGYNIARLFVPLLIVLMLFLTKDRFSKIPKRSLVMPFAVLVLILYTILITLISRGGYDSTKGTLIFSSATVQASNLEIRSFIEEKNPLIAKALFNSYFSNAIYFIKNFFSYFNADFFFVRGSAHGNHGIGNVGQFYIFEVASILVGAFAVLRRKNEGAVLLFGWILVVVGVASLTREAPHATRSFFMIVPLILLSAIGLNKILKRIKLLPDKYSYIAIFLSAIGVMYFVGYYLSSYYFRFPILYAPSYRSEDVKLIKVLIDTYDEYDVIYIDNKADLLYTSILFYSRFDPSEFQNGAVRAGDDSEGFSRVIFFGKFEYVNVENTAFQENSLLVSNREIAGYHVLQRFDYPKRPVVIPKGQEILQFPVTDNAYVLLEKN